jgi:hypothetical protein
MPRSKVRFKATDAVASVSEAQYVHAESTGELQLLGSEWIAHDQFGLEPGNSVQALTRGQKAALSRKRNELSQAIDDLNNQPMGK